jgi:hypothetical protein
VEEPYEEPRRSSMPLRPPDKPPMEGLWGIGSPRESTCILASYQTLDENETYPASRGIAHERE